MGRTTTHALIHLVPTPLPGFLKFIPISYFLWPRENRVILSKPYFIYRGGYPFLEPLSAALLGPPFQTEVSQSHLPAPSESSFQQLTSQHQPLCTGFSHPSDPCTLEIPEEGARFTYMLLLPATFEQQLSDTLRCPAVSL